MPALPLTRRQHEIFTFLNAFLLEHGFAPSLTEIGQRFDFTSLGTVHKHLEALTAKGYIKRTWNGRRAIEILVTGGVCPTCQRAFPTAAEGAA